MHVAFLHYSAPPIVGGVESVLSHQARHLRALGYTVSIIAGRGEQVEPDIPFIHLPLADSRHERVLQVKAELDHGNLSEAFDRLREALRAALSEALTGVDALIAHNVCSLHKNLALTAALYDLFCDPAFTQSGTRLVLWHHDLAWTAPRYQKELHPGYPWNLLRTAWPGVTQVAISMQRRAELAELFSVPSETIQFIPNGLDVERFYKLEAHTIQLANRMRLTESDLILLLPVRLTPRKNIELAIRTVAELRTYFRRPVLIVTGPLGPHNPANARYFQTMLALRAELGLENNVFLLAEWSRQFLPDPVIADFYRLADALFFPSLEEGFGLPMLEAAISRLPIFCSDIPALRALGEASAHFFSPHADPRQLAGEITARLQQDTVFRSAVDTRAHYSWEQICLRAVKPLLDGLFERKS